MQVNFDGAHRGAKVTTKRISDTQFACNRHAGARRAGPTSQSVMIEYLYPG